MLHSLLVAGETPPRPAFVFAALSHHRGMAHKLDGAHGTVAIPRRWRRTGNVGNVW